MKRYLITIIGGGIVGGTAAPMSEYPIRFMICILTYNIVAYYLMTTREGR